MASNFNKFRSKEGKCALMNAAYAPSELEYQRYLRELERLRPEMHAWASRFRKSLWLQHCDEGRRKEHEAHAQIAAVNVWTKFLLSEIKKHKDDLPKMRVTSCDRRSAVFVVEEVVPIMGSHEAVYRVRLRQ
ncbi:hypothetical protein PIB30_042119 [Stylosanthes scabra]|uniref:Uncharacterized protein n=1 Tax=Stylosanthes scabra TaxID=79078 RepID=A0ABU6VH85_9FABA|nr:hypothetical protein [Stylosanthes scabra]